MHYFVFIRVGGKIDPRDVVDGHREKTLHVLWRIIFAFQIEVLLSEEQLRLEIHFLKQNFCYKAKLEALLNQDDDNLGKIILYTVGNIILYI